jgi:ataxin-3
VDHASLPQAGPSPPPARRRRQEDLAPTSPDSEAFPIDPARRSSRQQSFPTGLDEEISSDDLDLDPTGEPGTRPQRAGHYDPIMDEEPYERGPSDFQFASRSYDDEDEALQAALKASMQDLPADWKAPEPKPKPERKSVMSAADRMKAAQDKAQAALSRERELREQVEAEEKQRQQEAEDEEKEEKLEDLSPGKSSLGVSKTVLSDPEEIRRRRLARFG